MHKTFFTVLSAALFSFAVGSATPIDPDQATRSWWAHVRALAADEMKGREAGTEGHRKAARYVASQFKRSGLRPAGEDGYYQQVPLHAVRLVSDRSSVSLVWRDGRTVPLRWLRDITTQPRLGLPATFDAELVFEGYEVPPELDIKGKILVVLAPPRFVAGPRGYVRPPPPGSRGTIIIESPAGPEPARWPAFTSQVMSRSPIPPAADSSAPFFMLLNPALAETLFESAAHTYREMRQMAEAGERMPSFPLDARLRGSIATETRQVGSDNVIGLLRGSDPVFADEYVALSAHLDGYGVGEPVNGDRIYNGAFDDAAYVATLLEFAERLRASGQRFKRSLLFCAFTAEELGLLGSEHFLAQPTVPAGRIVANINLDGLRPIFPLRILTTLALDDSTLGDTARHVGESLNIQIRADPEPDRVMLRRSDQWSFLQAGIPALAFTFGFERGSPEEMLYRNWYTQRYHSPLDDVMQPWSPNGAAQFNEFFQRLVADIANAPNRPVWKEGRAYPR